MIVYGANCVWWDDVEKAATISSEPDSIPLPCCPHCKGMLFQMEDSEWDEAVNKYDITSPGYKAYIEWLKGKCYKLDEDARKAYQDNQIPPLRSVNTDKDVAKLFPEGVIPKMNEPTLAEALQDMILTAIKGNRIRQEGSYVMLSIDLLTQLGLVTSEAAELLSSQINFSHTTKASPDRL